MYTPQNFCLSSRDEQYAFISEYSFATIVTSCGQSLHATHMPVLLRQADGVLISHIARANPQSRHLESQCEVLIIFNGPHAYVSPTWYSTSPSVPTWNYVAVHVYGKPRIVSTDLHVRDILREMVKHYDSGNVSAWERDLPEGFVDRMLPEIVAFEIEIIRIEGKQKLSQNRSLEDQQKVINALSKSNDHSAKELAQLMSLRLSKADKK